MDIILQCYMVYHIVLTSVLHDFYAVASTQCQRHSQAIMKEKILYFEH